MAQKRALVVGISDYQHKDIANLKNPVNDAKAVAELLKFNNAAPGSQYKPPNYDVELLLGSNIDLVSREQLYSKIRWLFDGNLDGALFYFAGHAVRSELDDIDYFVTSNGQRDNYGVAMSFLVRQANDAFPRIKSSTIILDCCHAGAAGNLHFSDNISEIGNGVTILTSCQSSEPARDVGARKDHGAFTSLLLDALEGQAADILGRVTPASIYNLVDSRLSANEQRPVYKTNVSQFIEIRKCAPTISLSNLAELVSIFPKPDDTYDLDPEHERKNDRGKGFDKIMGEFPDDDVKHAVYRVLQSCFKNGLIKIIEPKDKPEKWDEMTDKADWPPKDSGSFSMWHAAIFSAQCRLNHVGRHYWTLAKENKLH